MRAKPAIASAALLMLATAASAAPLCITDTLAGYAALGPNGCEIGLFTAKDFTFGVLSSSGGAVPISAANVTVTPSLLPGIQFSFTSAGFSVMGQQSVSYLFEYTIDPPPIIIRGFEDDLLSETPVFPGIASVTTNLCAGAAFSGFIGVQQVGGSICPVPGASFTLNVFHAGNTSRTHDAVSFAPTNIVGVRHTLTLAANGASSSILGISGTAVVPEPSTVLLAGAAVALFALRRGRSTRRP